MAHIEKRQRTRRGGTTSTAWRARYVAPDGRERSRSFDRKVDAERWLTETGAAILRGGWADPALGRRTVGEWYEQWWPSTVNLRPSTRHRDSCLYRRHVLPALGHRQLVSVTQPDVVALVALLSAKGLSPATVTKTAQLTGKLFGAAVDAGLLAVSPYRRVPLPRVEPDEMRFLDPGEVARLADAIDPRYRALVLVAAYGGLRIGELAGLRRSRVDPLRGTVEVVEIVTEVAGVVAAGPPKTKASRRRVALPRRVVDVLAEHLAAYTGGEPDAYVFTAPDGGVLRRSGFRSRHWTAATRAAGLDGLRIHDLRHTAVALWIASGANVKDVSVRAGHTSASFTLDRYGHRFPSADDALAQRLDAIFEAAPTTAPVVKITAQ